MKGGSFSISTFSVTTKRLLRCFLGGLPTIGIVSFGPGLMRLIGLVLGGVWGDEGDTTSFACCVELVEEAERLDLRGGSAGASTTTVGGVGDGASDERRLSWVEGELEAGEFEREEDCEFAAFVVGFGNGFAVFGGAFAFCFASFDFELESFLLSCNVLFMS